MVECTAWDRDASSTPAVPKNFLINFLFMVSSNRNRRVRKTLNKFYRHQQADLWGRVASSNKLNNTSKYLYTLIF